MIEKLIKLFNKIFYFSCLLWFAIPSVFAGESLREKIDQAEQLQHGGQILTLPKTSFGEIADNVFGVEMSVGKLMKTVCIATGICLALFSIVQFMKHRKNPIETPLSTVIMTFLVGLALIGLSLIPFVT